MDEQQLAGIAAALYTQPLEGFVAARTAAAKAAAEDSGRALADAVRALPKPSAAAWAVNMLAVHRPDSLGELADLGAAMRSAQDDLDAGALRTLSQERRQLLNQVMEAARDVTEQQGRKLSSAVATEVEQTLRAVTVDEGAAAAVRSGRLLRVLSADGVDRVDVGDAVAVPSVLTLPAGPEPEVRQAPSGPPPSKGGTAKGGTGKAGTVKDGTAKRKTAGGIVSGGTPKAGAAKAGPGRRPAVVENDTAPAAASAEKPRLKAVRTERAAPSPSVLERAAARLAEAEAASQAAAEEARERIEEFEEAASTLTRLGEEARSLRERLKKVDEEFEQARKRRESAAAQMQLASRAAEKVQRAEMLARERVLRLRNTPD
ncbi:hypothetical protein [Arthrobacter sp. ISL-72]|uniref:hypothetical protein n=1 Tax=Arthrobacter sp. ISL-72 TaxID=2819114 RepID=UPI001BECBB31|nr:hypothetical protein [Arthrobacter sp. ISL-72]MBT2595157.1 hypothetical protein [Arthrobacter sp. ISL-72]